VIVRYHLRLLFTGKGRIAIILALVGSLIMHLVFAAMIYMLSNEELFTQMFQSMGRPPQQTRSFEGPGLGSRPEGAEGSSREDRGEGRGADRRSSRRSREERPPFGAMRPSWLTIDQMFFFRMFLYQSITVAFLALVVGAGLIADDRRDNALPFYLSKPITATEYLVGKFSVIAFFVLLVTAIPINLLFLLQVLADGGMPFLRQYWWLPLSITGFSFLIALVTGALMLVASSLVKKAALAGVLVFGLVFGFNMMAGLLSQTYHNEWCFLISPQFAIHRVGMWWFRVTDFKMLNMYQFSGPDALAVLSALIVFGWLIIWWRIRPVEVVK
jgi:ABC-type transport system involved in multi-copper enzyme maturation permease subunit